MKNSIISIFFLLTPISVFPQQTDPYIDSLFYTNIKALYEKCKTDFYYNPISDNRRDLHDFLMTFAYISHLDIIGIPYQPPITDYDKIKELDNWYKKYGSCITKLDYLGIRRVSDDIESFNSFEEYVEFLHNIFDRIDKKINDYEQRVSSGKGH